MHLRPASITLHFELSIMIGTRAISGSPATRFKKRTIAAWLSSIASSMLTSMICAPFSTCWRATASACSNWPPRIMRANAFEPVTLVRSPMLTNSEPSPMDTGSRPESFIGGGAVESAVSVMAAGFKSRGSHRDRASRVSAVERRAKKRAVPKPGSAGAHGSGRCRNAPWARRDCRATSDVLIGQADAPQTNQGRATPGLVGLLSRRGDAPRSGP
jgi:hypothetical protein